MVSSYDGYNYVVRLERGERLSEAMEQLFAESDTQILGASVSGVGAAEQLTLGFYDLETKEYIWRDFESMYEITGLLGTVARDEHDNLMSHLHGTFSDRSYQVIGGHVKDFVVGGTCELFIHVTYKPLKRLHDDQTGLKLLDL
ncbi:MAG TPA: PPC domain-containing DNA-binding protein [Candidatus Saccharimonadales bacterium]|nr:PPC domain-containing DNA-binding protein [Candidatus Saccharimonadales bacterium]